MPQNAEYVFAASTVAVVGLLLLVCAVISYLLRRFTARLFLPVWWSARVCHLTSLGRIPLVCESLWRCSREDEICLSVLQAWLFAQAN